MVGRSLACGLHGFATSVLFFGVARFLLGMGEGGGFSGITKAISERFPEKERSTAMGVAGPLMLVALAISKSPISAAMVLFSIPFFGQQFWSTMMTLPADVFPKNTFGSVAGLEGCGGALGGMFFAFLVGYLLDHGFGYFPVFVKVSIFYPIGFLLILLRFRKVEPVTLLPDSAHK